MHTLVSSLEGSWSSRTHSLCKEEDQGNGRSFQKGMENLLKFIERVILFANYLGYQAL